jgi:cytochrome c oxidase subunit III
MIPPPPARSAPPLEGNSLPRQLTGLTSPITWGILMLVAIEATLLLLFGVSYFYLSLGAEEWPPAGVAPPALLAPAVGQALLLASVLPPWWGLRALAGGRSRRLLVALPAGLVLVAGYLVLKAWEYGNREVLWSAHAYGSLDWTMGGYAALHVVAVLLAGSVIFALTLRGHFTGERYTGVQALVLYWAFVALGSLFLFAVQYLAPYL